MADPNFRGVVLGSSWRLREYLFSRFGPNQEIIPPKQPTRMYLGQSWAIDPLVRRSLLYFDKVVWPTNNAIHQGKLDSIPFLVGEGQLEQETIYLHLNPVLAQFLTLTNLDKVALEGERARVAERVAKFHREVFEKREKAQPGAWNYTTVGEGIDFDGDQIIRGYSMSLYNCLPVPQETVSYEHIVAFKKKEHNALLDMRAALDEMYVRIASCDDKPFAAQVEQAKLQKAITSVQDLLTKSQLLYYLKSVQVDLTPKNLLKAAGTAIAPQALATLNISLAAPWAQVVAGAFAASMVIKSVDFRTPTTRAGAWKYLYKAGKSEIIDPASAAEEKDE